MDAQAEREFGEFVAARSLTLLRIARVLTGDRHRADRRLDVQMALRRLAPRQRAVLVLRYLEDLPEAAVMATTWVIAQRDDQQRADCRSST